MRTANRVCENCECFRSDHSRGLRCRRCKGCEQFKFTEPVKTKRPAARVFTADELTKAQTMLDAGYTYSAVGRMLHRRAATVRNRFPGYGGNAAQNNHSGVAWRQTWDYSDRKYYARQQIRKAEHAATGRGNSIGCAFDGGNVCDRTTYAKGLCQAHYGQWRRRGVLTPIGQRRPRAARLCTFEACGRKHYAHGLCQAHYKQHQNHRELAPIKSKPSKGEQ